MVYLTIALVASVSMAQTTTPPNPMIEGWDRLTMKSFGISIEIPDTFVGVEGRSVIRRPGESVTPGGESVTLSSFESSTKQGPTDYSIRISRRRPPRKHELEWNRCVSEKLPVPAIKGAWWCQRMVFADERESHFARIPTKSGEVDVAIAAPNIGMPAIARILRSLEILPVAK